MRKIIDGKVYDTATAVLVCDVSGPSQSRGDFSYDDTQLYRSPKGRFFVAGEGGPRSRWAKLTGEGNWGGGEGLELVTLEEARDLFEQHGDPDDYVEHFGEPEEG